MGTIFHLEVGADHLATLTFDTPDKKANIFTREALEELERTVAELAGRDDIGCLVLVSAKPGMFIAGADVELIARVSDPEEAEAGVRFGQALFAAWEALPFPTVAAIDGTCVGGGMEIALASSWIVVSDRPELRIGLPEVQLGIVPAWGGCTRLPRRVGAIAALDIILAGKTVPGRRAAKIGLADAIFPSAGFYHHVRDFARARIGAKKRRRRRGFKAFLLEGHPLGRRVLFDQAKKKTLSQTKGNYPAPVAALQAVRTGLERGRKAGFEAEVRAASELATGAIAKNLIHVFRLVEASKKDAQGDPLPPVRQAAVLGAGTMGGGIAQLVADRAGIPIRVKDLQPEALATALRHARSLFDRQLQRRRIRKPELLRKMNLIQPTLEDAGLETSDLVIEAIVENLAVKQKVFADLAQRLPSSAILVSNTSSLSIDQIGALATHRQRIAGMHFFNPVHKMPLVEVIAGTVTSDDTTRAVAEFARKLGKTPVVVRDGPGFLVNRLLAFYSAEAMWLLDERHRVEAIDRAMVTWGMPMGPLRLADEVGLDVSAKVGHILHEAFPDRLQFPPWIDRLAGDTKRLGLKSGLGVYRYENRREKDVDPAIYAVLGIEPDRDLAPPDPRRMILPMVNEAARCLEERIVPAAGPLDLALVFGTGFPPFRGGLCRWADAEGLPQIIGELEALAATVSPRLAPSPALRRLAERGGFYRGRS